MDKALFKNLTRHQQQKLLSLLKRRELNKAFSYLKPDINYWLKILYTDAPHNLSYILANKYFPGDYTQFKEQVLKEDARQEISYIYLKRLKHFKVTQEAQSPVALLHLKLQIIKNIGFYLQKNSKQKVYSDFNHYSSFENNENLLNTKLDLDKMDPYFSYCLLTGLINSEEQHLLELTKTHTPYRTIRRYLNEAA